MNASSAKIKAGSAGEIKFAMPMMVTMIGLAMKALSANLASRHFAAMIADMTQRGAEAR